MDRLALRKYRQDPDLAPDLEQALIDVNRRIADAVHHLNSAGLVDSTYLRQPIQDYKLQRKNGQKVATFKIRNAKLHFLAGADSHVIHAVFVTDGDYSDKISLKPLIDELRAQNKRLEFIAADNGYNSIENYELVYRALMTPFLDFAEDAVPSGKSRIYDQQMREWKLDTPRWKAGYDRRKVIEAINHAFKMVLTRRLRSRLEHSSRIEALCYVVAFNLTRLVLACLTRGVHVPWADDRARHKRLMRMGESSVTAAFLTASA